MRYCGAGYAQSLAVLATAKRASNDSLLTKSSIMLGVGESGTVAVLRVLTATSTDCDRIAAAVVYVVLRRVSPVDGHSSQRIVYRCTHV
jgi:lipoate synthase